MSEPFKLERSERRHVGDRFLRNRTETVNRIQQRLYTDPEPVDAGADAILYRKLYSTCRETYKGLLASTLAIKREAPTWTPVWPVRHRDKPFIKSPNVILDLPNVDSGFCLNLMDWSSSDYLTVAFPTSVYLWHASSSTTLRYPAFHPTCIKWNIEGTKILTANKFGYLALTSMETQYAHGGTNLILCHTECFITSAAFHPSNPFVLVCCNKGGICGYSSRKGLVGVFSKVLFKCAITQVAYSSDGTHVAVTTTGGWVAFLSTNRDYDLVARLKLAGPCRAVAWHPWKTNYVVVADCLGHLYVYDVLTLWQTSHPQPLASYSSTYFCAIVAMSFNPHSAELIISQRTYNDGPSDDVMDMEDLGETHLSVLASVDRVVDRLVGHTGRVHFLSWSPDGTRLATSGTDESARIWDFLPKKRRTSETKIKKRCSETRHLYNGFHLNEGFGYSLR